MSEDRMQASDWLIIVMNEIVTDDWLNEMRGTTDVWGWMQEITNYGQLMIRTQSSHMYEKCK